MTVDLAFVPRVARAAVTDALAIFNAIDSGKQAMFADLDDPAALTVESATANNVAMVEVEFDNLPVTPDEEGAPGQNHFRGDSMFLVHVHIPKRWHMDLARNIVSAVINGTVGQISEGVYFEEAVPVDHDLDGEGLTRGLTYAIRFRHDIFA